jgi:hypothetical protein
MRLIELKVSANCSKFDRAHRRADPTAWMTTMADSTQLDLQEQVLRIACAIAETARTCRVLVAPSWKTGSMTRMDSSWAGSLADYSIPIATDFPRIEGFRWGIGRHQPIPSALRGAGEGGIIPVGGLIANAITGAPSSLAAEPNELPLSLLRVWRFANPS